MTKNNDNVYSRIAAVAQDIAQTGIAKDRNNQQQGYKFRGIDDVYNALAPVISKHDLVILPRILSRECLERQSSKGGALFNVVVEAEFDFVSARDGSKHTVKTYGEAMDSADKATNKAMSAAYKYAAFQAFCIPTQADNDADAHTPEVASKPKEIVATLTDEEVANVTAIASEVGRTTEQLCKSLGVTQLSEVPRLRYQAIIKSLEKLRAPVKPTEQANA